MKKSTSILMLVIGLLIISITILATLNNSDVEERRVLEKNREFIINIDGEQVAKVTLAELYDLEPVKFTTVMDTSNTNPTDVEFTGVEVSKICKSKGIDISTVSVFEFKALDSYASAVTIDEIQEPENVYICVEIDGEQLKNKDDGGMGPFLMVIKNAQFSQRWCKYLMELNIR